MRPLPPFERPSDKQAALRRAWKLEVVSLLYGVSRVVFIGLVMGGSQAMRTAWIEDLLTLIPPIAFMIGARTADRAANERFPYGYHRATTIVFLCSAVALSGLGVYLLTEGMITLVKAERPAIGAMVLGGHVVWQGWLMLAALAWGAPMMWLGRRKTKLACALHDKGLHTDGEMNRDDWFVGIAAGVGVLGVGIGWWWADAVAAIVISLDVCRDGFRDLGESVRDLMDGRPTTVDHRALTNVGLAIETELRYLPWVAAVNARVREHGQLLVGEVEVVPRDGIAKVEELEEAKRRATAVDWRLHALNVVPVRQP